MADVVESAADNMQSPDSKDEVFLNGEEDTERNDTMLTPEYGLEDQGVLPRRSSLLKDASRRQQQRKKTVSFSSMPNEKTVVDGRCRLFLIIVLFQLISLEVSAFFSVDCPISVCHQVWLCVRTIYGGIAQLD